MKIPRFALWQASLLALLLLNASTAWSQKAKPQPSPAVEEFATMRDGVKLAADVYKPAGEGPWPVVLMRTPYLKQNMARGGSHQRYTDNGYVYVVQDVRGTGKSEGDYIPFYNDREDGYDTVEWAAKQPWSNGKVGMTGASAMGIATNLAATANPPSLEAAYVIVAPHLRFDEASFMGGVFKQADTGDWMRRQGAGDQVPPLKRRVVWDEEWQLRDTAPNLSKITIPMFNVGGWYDIFAYGSVRNFMYLQQFGRPGAKGKQKLVMGPFGHGNLSGDLAYPDVDSLGATGKSDDEIRWFDYWLKGQDNGVMEEPPVRYFNMASARKGELSEGNGWRTAESWPPPHRPTRFYLQPGEKLAPAGPAAKARPIHYKFDPENPVPTVGGANLTFERGPMDQRAIGKRGDYLRFETGTLTEPVTIAGPVKVELWAATDGPDTDFVAKLVDVYPDGYEAIVLDAPIRTRYRNGRYPEAVEMMTPGEPVELEIDLWHTAITFEPGHKIALHITSSSAPRFEVNDNSGTAPGEAPKPRVATNTILLDAEHPSAVVLPVLID
ncbi:CocE/NonD family hydrolase [Gilvimarinus sp. F26214L]|uniref:CocE/NonD family hydrolase n=1 Tax=Gilvimarinus sp. DZF01 TaxID=3461371 RepID=UPI0040454351